MKTEILAYFNAMQLQAWQLKQSPGVAPIQLQPNISNSHADLMVIRMASNFSKTQKTEQLLNAMLSAIDIKYDSVNFISLDELNSDKKIFLNNQITLKKPKLLIALGEQAAQFLLNSQAPFIELRGKIHSYYEAPLIVTYAPDYLLQHPCEKSKTFEDLRMMRSVFS